MEKTYLRSAEAAEYMRLSPRTLEDMRCTGCGPKYYKTGPGPKSHVLYTKQDLDAWLEERHVRSTSEMQHVASRNLFATSASTRPDRKSVKRQIP